MLAHFLGVIEPTQEAEEQKEEIRDKRSKGIIGDDELPNNIKKK